MYLGEALAQIEAIWYNEVIKQLRKYTGSLTKHQSE
jgi:hypothetical protein